MQKKWKGKKPTGMLVCPSMGEILLLGKMHRTAWKLLSTLPWKLIHLKIGDGESAQHNGSSTTVMVWDSVSQQWGLTTLCCSWQRRCMTWTKSTNTFHGFYPLELNCEVVCTSSESAHNQTRLFHLQNSLDPHQSLSLINCTIFLAENSIRKKSFLSLVIWQPAVFLKHGKLF